MRWDSHGLITQKYTVSSQCDYSKISSWKEKKKLLSWLPREMRYLKNYIFLRTSTIPIANHVERVIFDNLILKLHHHFENYVSLHKSSFQDSLAFACIYFLMILYDFQFYHIQTRWRSSFASHSSWIISQTIFESLLNYPIGGLDLNIIFNSKL